MHDITYEHHFGCCFTSSSVCINGLDKIELYLCSLSSTSICKSKRGLISIPYKLFVTGTQLIFCIFIISYSTKWILICQKLKHIEAVLSVQILACLNIYLIFCKLPRLKLAWLLKYLTVCMHIVHTSPCMQVPTTRNVK